MIYNNLEIPTIVLSTKSHEHLGVLHGVDHSTIQLVRNMNAAQEISFDIHKTVDGVEEPLWDSIVSFKYIYLPKGGVITGNPGEYYSIEVSTDDTNETIKHITGTSACEFELSKRKLYDFEINTNADIEYQTQEYKQIYDKEPDKAVVKNWGTKFYNSNDHEHSLLHRVLKDKCPDYTIGTIEPTALANTQRTFSANGQNIYDFLTQTVAKEFECVFEFNSATRTINAYSLKMHCDDCGHNGEIASSCPNCGSANYHNYYGEETSIYISAENYAEQITCNGETDNVFNCLRVSGGDNIMTTSFMYINPTGSQYLYRFSEDMYEDMPVALVNKIRDYNTLYESRKEDAERYSLQYYTELDYLSQYQHGVPSITPVVTTAAEQATALPSKFSNFIRDNHYIVVQCRDISTIDTPPKYSTANNTIKGLAEVLVDARYDVEASGTLSGSGTYERTWTGTVKITSKGDKEETATTSSFSVTISRTIDKNEVSNQDTAAEYLYQRILKRMDRDDRYFKTVFNLPTVGDFNSEITRVYDTGEYANKPVYGLEMLKAFQKSYQACIDIMIENGVTQVNSTFYGMPLYTEMYLPYSQRLECLNTEIGVRDAQIAVQQNQVDAIQSLIDALHDELDFEDYLGAELFEVFSHYRMESEYTNSYYSSDGLTNAEIIDKARELYSVAAKEAIKASELQYTLSCSLNNLFQDKKFEPYVDKVKLGNWITLLSDNKPYALRLTQMDIDYGNLADIGVTFSDAVRLGGTVDDVQSVLSKASSMSSSYDTVSRQSKQGEVVYNQVDSWTQDGLDTALVTLKNNNNEEVMFDENGILLRSKDDIFEDYSPYQCKLTHNVMAFTRDNWETCALAIGESKYARYVEALGGGSIDTDNLGYGVCAEFVSAGYVYGSQIIAGDIYSSNYTKAVDFGGIIETGSHIDLDSGEFSLANGQITFRNNQLSIAVGDKSLTKTYTITGENEWVNSGTLVDNRPVYKSDSSYHVTDGQSRCKITFSGYDTFTIMACSDGEQGYDYLEISQLDATSITRNGNNYYTFKSTTPSSTNYTAVTFSNLDGGEHSVWLLYSKDGSVNQNSDRAYFYILEGSSTAYTDIDALENEEVLKVDNSGNIIKAKLKNTTGSTFKVSADNISFIANDTIELTTNSLGISSTNFTIDKTTGNVTINGSVTCNDGKITITNSNDGVTGVIESGLESIATQYYYYNSSTGTIDIASGGVALNPCIVIGSSFNLKLKSDTNIEGDLTVAGDINAFGYSLTARSAIVQDQVMSTTLWATGNVKSNKYKLYYRYNNTDYDFNFIEAKNSQTNIGWIIHGRGTNANAYIQSSATDMFDFSVFGTVGFSGSVIFGAGASFNGSAKFTTGSIDLGNATLSIETS